MNIKLSIITINYNNKDGLKKTIDSVVNQTLDCYEFIIIDGNSTDGSKDVLNDYVTHPKYGKKIAYASSEQDKGIYNAMNKGILQAHGKYCLFLNSGDYLISSQTLEKNIFTHIDNNIDIFYHNAIFQYGSEFRQITYPDKITFNFFFTRSFNHQSTLIKTNLLKKRPYNEDYKIASDFDFFVFMIFIQKCSAMHKNDALTIYEASGISASADEGSLHYNERQTILKRYFPLFYDDYLQLKLYNDSPYGAIINLMPKHRLADFFLRGLRKIILLLRKIT